MNVNVQDRMIGQLWHAQTGDKQAQGEVAMYCFTQYKDKLKKFFSHDPAISMEDLESTFFMGIFDGVLKADGRGNPLYFVGQCGIWRIGSEMRAMRRRIDNMSYFTRVADGTDEQDNAVDPMDPSTDFREIVASRLDDERIVRVIANANLRDRQREAMEVILSGAAGDPTELGFNKRLAEQMGVCPQRASQLTADLRHIYEGSV